MQKLKLNERDIRLKQNRSHCECHKSPWFGKTSLKKRKYQGILKLGFSVSEKKYRKKKYNAVIINDCKSHENKLVKRCGDVLSW